MNIFTINCTVYPYIYISSEPTVGSVFRFRSVPIELRIKINDAPAHAFYRTARRANADERHTERHTKQTTMAKVAKKTPVKKTAKGKVAKKVKDPNAPKRALSAYMFFAKDQRGNILKKHPNFSVTDVAKELGVQWKKLGDKSKYEAEAAKDKARYEAAMKKYKK